jgi:hypothetical protein
MRSAGLFDLRLQSSTVPCIRMCVCAYVCEASIYGCRAVLLHCIRMCVCMYAFMRGFDLRLRSSTVALYSFISVMYVYMYACMRGLDFRL